MDAKALKAEALAGRRSAARTDKEPVYSRTEFHSISMNKSTNKRRKT